MATISSACPCWQAGSVPLYPRRPTPSGAAHSSGLRLACVKLCARHGGHWSSTPVPRLPRTSCPLQVTLSDNTYDTILAVYTGAVVNALTLVVNNDNCTTGGSPGASCVVVPVTQGTVYRVQVDGAGGAKGSFRIAVAVAGDPIASPISVSLVGLGAQALTATTVGATREVGEPVLFAGLGESASVWFSWTAPRAGVLRVSTAGSPFNTVLGVYSTTGTATTGSVATFGSLTLLVSNNNCGTGTVTSCVTVTVARSGVRYLVKVDGTASAKGAVAIMFNFAAV